MAIESNHCRKILRNVLLALLVFVAVPCLTGCEEDADPTELYGEVDELRIGEGHTDATVVAGHNIGKSCWLCPVFQILFSAVEQAYMNIIPRVAKGARPLIGVFFALWLAIRTIRLVGSLTEPDYHSYWKDLGLKVFWLCVCFIICGDITWVLDTIIMPIYYGFVELGILVTNSINNSQVHCSSNITNYSGMSSTYICLLRSIQGSFNGLEEGALAMVKAGPWATIPICLMTYCAAAIMALYFPVLLVDSVVRYGLTACFIPLGVIAVGYNPTRQYAAKILKMIVGIGMQVVGVCIFIGITISVMDIYMNRLADGFPTALSSIADLEKAAEWYENSPGLMGFFFIVVFCILFAETSLDVTDNFGIMHAGGAMGTVSSMFSVANKVKQTGSFAKNRVTRKIDMSEKKKLEALESKKKSGKKLNKKELIQAERLKDSLTAKGYLAKDSNGVLRKTMAYDQLSKRGAAAWLSNVSTDWYNSGSQQMDSRIDRPLVGKKNQNNKLTDILEV